MIAYHAITQRLLDIESAFPVQDLSYRGIRVWPLLRQRLASQMFWNSCEMDLGHSLELHDAFIEARSRLQPDAGVDAQIHQLEKALTGIGSVNLPPLPGGVVFCTMGFEYVMLRNGQYFNRFADPVKEQLEALGIASLDLECGFQGKVYEPKQFRTLNVEQVVSISGSLASLKVVAGRAGDVQGIRPLLELLRDTGCPSELDYASFLSDCSLLHELSRVFGMLLGRLGPRLGVVVCYYNVVSMAFLHACHSLGIPSLELQHSVISEWDWNWSHFASMPAAGYSILPDRFWSWSDDVSRMLATHLPQDAPKLRPVTGVNLWVDAWRKRDGHSIPDDVLALRGRKKTILYTPPIGDERMTGELFPPEFMEAVRLSPPGWQWIVRVHYKTSPRAMAVYKAHLAALGSRASVHLGPEYQLYDLFSIADVHVSQTSTTILEAEAFGVPTIIISPAGAEWFATEIAAGRFAFAATAQELLVAMAGNRRDAVGPPAIRTDPRVAGGVLRTVFDMPAPAAVPTAGAGLGL